jgi:serine/threonine-protein kinase
LRLIREAKAASALNHPNIVTIYDVLTQDGQFFIAMEYVEGSTLKELVSNGRLQLAYAVQISGALAKTHAAGVVNRDLKPSNVMVTADGQIKLLDFGMAKLAEIPEAASDETARLGLTQEGMALGSVGYMSPEQAEGLRVDPRSDIFSLVSCSTKCSPASAPFSGPASFPLWPPCCTKVPRRCTPT